MYKIVQTNNCYSRISRNYAKADRYKTRFFHAKFRDERAKARSEVLTKRFLRINCRAGSILERIEASCFRKIPNKWLKWRVSASSLRWRATVRPRIVNIIISCSEGGAHSTTQYISMAEIESRIFSQNFGCCVETCVS